MPVLCSVLGMVARMDTMDCMKPVQCCELSGLNRSLRIHSECWDVHHLHSSVPQTTLPLVFALHSHETLMIKG